MLRCKSAFVRAGLHGILVLLPLIFSPGAHASVEWLLQQAQPNGSIMMLARKKMMNTE